jgi:hypothetical protein
VFFCLLSSKHSKLYEAVFKHFKVQHNVTPKVVFSDFESSLQKAAVKVFKPRDLVGCNFHYRKAVSRKAEGFMGDLVKGKHSNAHAKLAVKLFQELSFLTPDYLVEGLQIIVRHLADHNLTAEFKQFYE